MKKINKKQLIAGSIPFLTIGVLTPLIVSNVNDNNNSIVLKEDNFKKHSSNRSFDESNNAWSANVLFKNSGSYYSQSIGNIIETGKRGILVPSIDDKQQKTTLSYIDNTTGSVIWQPTWNGSVQYFDSICSVAYSEKHNSFIIVEIRDKNGSWNNALKITIFNEENGERTSQELVGQLGFDASLSNDLIQQQSWHITKDGNNDDLFYIYPQVNSYFNNNSYIKVVRIDLANRSTKAKLIEHTYTSSTTAFDIISQMGFLTDASGDTYVTILGKAKNSINFSNILFVYNDETKSWNYLTSIETGLSSRRSQPDTQIFSPIGNSGPIQYKEFYIAKENQNEDTISVVQLISTGTGNSIFKFKISIANRNIVSGSNELIDIENQTNTGLDNFRTKITNAWIVKDVLYLHANATTIKQSVKYKQALITIVLSDIDGTKNNAMDGLTTNSVQNWNGDNSENSRIKVYGNLENNLPQNNSGNLLDVGIIPVSFPSDLNKVMLFNYGSRLFWSIDTTADNYKGQILKPVINDTVIIFPEEGVAGWVWAIISISIIIVIGGAAFAIWFFLNKKKKEEEAKRRASMRKVAQPARPQALLPGSGPQLTGPGAKPNAAQPGQPGAPGANPNGPQPGVPGGPVPGQQQGGVPRPGMNGMAAQKPGVKPSAPLPPKIEIKAPPKSYAPVKKSK